MTRLAVTAKPAATTKADAVVVGVLQGPKGLLLAPGSESVAAAFGKALLPALVGLGATGRAEEVTRFASLGATTAPVVVAVGLGAPGAGDHEGLRRAAGAAVRALAGSRSVAVALPTEDAVSLRAVAEGALLGAYAFTPYRTTSLAAHRAPVTTVTLVTGLGREAAAVVRRATVVARAVHLARDLVNTPPSDLHPVELAAAASTYAGGAGATVEVLDEKALRKGGFGGILGVGQGSANPPRLVHLTYHGKGATTTVALIGKGITFDSGGISIKPAAGMEDMKSDMGGAAAVLATVNAAAQLGLAVNVVGYAPMCENMPSGTAIRPSDVLTMYGGKRVEVLNTDAEGRLILADALVRAAEDSPDYLVDVATLTGAQLVALGAHTAGVMGNDDDFRGRVVDASARAGEQMWPMPLPPELRRSLDSDVADIANLGDRYGGMLTAGLFLQDFVAEGIPWAHLDIAGPAYNQGAEHGYTPKGGTGAAVRTLVELLEDIAASS